MTSLLIVSYVLHVIAAAFWTGAVLYGVYALFPAASAGTVGREGFVDGVDKLLRVTRYTGVVLPITGGYQLWVLYPPELLFETTQGHLVLGMIALWGLLNGVIELGVLRTRRLCDDVGVGRYLVEGFPQTALTDDVSASALLATARPYFVAAAGLTVLLLVDAALLAAGV